MTSFYKYLKKDFYFYFRDSGLNCLNKKVTDTKSLIKGKKRGSDVLLPLYSFLPLFHFQQLPGLGKISASQLIEINSTGDFMTSRIKSIPLHRIFAIILFLI